jgi:hypothetical protein
VSVPSDPPPVKLFFALLAAPEAPLEDLERRLSAEFNPIDVRLDDFDFEAYSTYYGPEMGLGLRKRMIACEGTIGRDELPGIKLHANRLEKFYAGKEERGRTINIDPGYLDSSRVVLATGKDHGHRIYIGRGIWAETTLLYRRRPPGFEPLPWTYRDYRRDETLAFFNEARAIYRREMRERQ